MLEKSALLAEFRAFAENEYNGLAGERNHKEKAKKINTMIKECNCTH